MPKSSVLIYGATGHSGRLIAARARDLGIEAILAGRSAERLDPLGRQFGYRWLAFGLDQPLRIDAALSEAAVVVNAAGPFAQTALPLVQACLRTGTHYLDIAGELPVFQRAERHHQQAERLGVMLMPGASFFITATDCLAAHVSRRCPQALYLRIATIALDAPSRGTARSMIENIHGSVSIREAGALATMQVGRARRQFDFGEGPRWCSAVTAADVFTAWYTTGIRNIEAYASLTPLQASGYELTAMFAAPLRLPPAGYALKAIAGLLPAGPSATSRAAARHVLVAEVEDPWQQIRSTRLTTPDGYEFGCEITVAIAQRVLAGDFRPGFRTPAAVYGADFILEMGRVVRTDFDRAEALLRPAGPNPNNNPLSELGAQR